MKIPAQIPVYFTVYLDTSYTSDFCFAFTGSM